MRALFLSFPKMQSRLIVREKQSFRHSSNCILRWEFRMRNHVHQDHIRNWKRPRKDLITGTKPFTRKLMLQNSTTPMKLRLMSYTKWDSVRQLCINMMASPVEPGRWSHLENFRRKKVCLSRKSLLFIRFNAALHDKH